MSELTQKDRLIAIKPPADDFEEDDLLLTSFNGTETISDLFEYQIEVLSKNHEIKPETLVGKPVTITIQNKLERKFSGYINSFTYGEVKSDNLRVYRMTMVPWLWFLSKTNNCRIFQEITTKDIISELFQEYGFTDYEYIADGGVEPREYCVQYNESDLNFISRLLEEDGIAYYFKQDEDKHVMHIVDAINAYESCDEAEIVYSKGNHPGTQISRWEHAYEYRKGKWTLDDYDFKQPTSDQKTNEKTTKQSFAKDAEYKHYEYQSYHNFSGLDDLAQKRIEAEDTPKNMVEASSDCTSFYAGGKFELIQHSVDAELGDYKITTINHHAYDNSYLAGHDSESGYSNELVCISDLIHYRPALSHSKPIMHGPQSATVVGPSGEEIYVDDLGRIKVKFHWDHTSNQSDETSSCYIQVMQPWAGAGWGTSFIPRIGMEVVVNFYDGDVDRPLIMGSVYNGDNNPPFENKTQSGIRTRSSMGGSKSNFNELSFDDFKGEEEIYIHAEKDLNKNVKNDVNETVHNDINLNVKNDINENVNNDINQIVDNDINQDVMNDINQQVMNNINQDVMRNKNQNIMGDSNINITGFLNEKVGNKDYLSFANTKECVIGLKSSTFVGLEHSAFLGAKVSTNASYEISVVKGAKRTVSEASELRKNKDVEINASVEYVIKSPKIVLKSGKNTVVTITNDLVSIKSKVVNMSGKLNVRDNIKTKKQIIAKNFKSS